METCPANKTKQRAIIPISFLIIPECKQIQARNGRGHE